MFRIDGPENIGHSMGGPNFGEINKRPYENFECHHARRFDNNGVLTCLDCGATYNETTLTWEQS
jgi:hypothetical protein